MSYVAYQQSPHQARNKLLRWAFFGLILILISAGTWTALNAFRDLQNLRALHPHTKRIQEALSNKKTTAYYEDLIPESTTPQKTGTQSLSFLISKYVSAAELPTAPSTSNTYLYTFKTGLSQHDTDSLASTLLDGSSTTEYTEGGKIVTYSSSTGVLAVNTQNGSFTFESLTRKVPLKFNSNSSDMKDVLTSYLQTSGIIDETVETTAYYTRSTAPGITFYELHRSWEAVGYPIVNPIASAGLPENVTIEELSLETTYANAPRDTTIISASDVVGRARNADFNTMTVAIANNGTIVSIDSNIRPIASRTSLSELGIELLNPQNVVTELEAGGGYFSMALPAGQGIIDPQKLFADNTFQAQNAKITDISLTYIEKQPTVEQKYMIPAYLVRGTAETDSGIQTTFAQTIPALGNDVSLTQAEPLFSKLISFVQNAFNIETYAQEFRERFDRLTTGTIVQTSQLQPIPQKSDGLNCRREIIYPCGDGNTNIKCTFSINTCPSPTPKPPTPFITDTPKITDLPKVTPHQPSATPIPDEPGSTKPCVLYKPISGGEVEIIERGYLAENTGISSKIYEYSGSYTIPGIGALTYFPVSLPEGPIAVLKYPTQEPAPPYGDSRSYGYGNVPYGQSYGALQADIELEAALRGVRRIKENPSLYRKIDHPRYQLQVLDANAIFPEVKYDLNDNRIINASTINWLIEQAVQGYNGWSIDTFLKQESPMPDVPTEILIGSRRATYGDNPIATSIGDLILDKRCDFQSPISPALYIYPQEKTSLTLSFDHDHTAYIDPVLSKNIHITAAPDGTLSFDNSDVSRNKIYYEYSGVSLPRPEHGWNIPSDSLFEFVHSLADEINLTQKETSDLLQDISASLVRKELGETTFVGIVHESAIHQLLPMSFSHPVHMQRIHVYIGSPVDNIVAPEKLPSVTRKHDLTVLELGVYVE